MSGNWIEVGSTDPSSNREKINWMLQWIIDGTVTQTYYVFQPKSNYDWNELVSDATYLEWQKKCCEKLIRETIASLEKWNYYTFDWKPWVRRALEFVEKEFTGFCSNPKIIALYKSDRYNF